MTETKKIIIGTRGSTLALAQTNLVVEALQSRNANVEIEIKIITTKGDVDQSPIPLETVGKSWFTEEIEQALLKNEIDVAVHSLKDLSPIIPSGLITLAVLKRADPRDVLIIKSKRSFKDLLAGSIIGTDSLRRKALLLEQRPNVVVKSIRGNVDTRIKKLATEDYDAIMLAAAGLERIHMLDAATDFLDPSIFIPAIGQGVLTVQVRDSEVDILRMLKELQDSVTLAAVDAEQAFSRVIGGGCKLPVGCYAKPEGDTIFIHAMLGSENGEKFIRKSATDASGKGVELAETLARELLQAIDGI